MKVFSISRKIQLHTNCGYVDLCPWKSITESVYLAIVLLQPPASIATNFFFAL